jgi:hypothetical protein
MFHKPLKNKVRVEEFILRYLSRKATFKNGSKDCLLGTLHEVML